MTEEQIAIYQEQVDEYYSRFVEIVADGRGMTEDGVKALADGRTYTASQEKENGLIDEIALYDDMKTAMSEELRRWLSASVIFECMVACEIVSFLTAKEQGKSRW